MLSQKVLNAIGKIFSKNVIFFHFIFYTWQIAISCHGLTFVVTLQMIVYAIVKQMKLAENQFQIMAAVKKAKNIRDSIILCLWTL